MTMKKLLVAATAVALLSAPAVAQTDVGSPIGGGAGLGGSVAPLGVPGGAASSFSALASEFSNSDDDGVEVVNPAGGTATLPAAAARAIGALLSGNGTAADVQTAAAAFGGTPAATALANALQAMGNSLSPETAAAAVNAHNAAVDALPAGANPGPGLMASRQVLAGFVN